MDGTNSDQEFSDDPMRHTMAEIRENFTSINPLGLIIFSWDGK